MYVVFPVELEGNQVVLISSWRRRHYRRPYDNIGYLIFGSTATIFGGTAELLFEACIVRCLVVSTNQIAMTEELLDGRPPEPIDEENLKGGRTASRKSYM